MDGGRFEQAYQKIVIEERQKKGIGTLGEKTVHAVLKKYFEPDENKQEVKVGKYVADIYTGNEIIEIQSKQFQKLRKKLDYFLSDHRVTLVYPIPEKKHLFWIDSESGEISKGRISPKRGTKYDVFPELYRIKPYLKNPNLKIVLSLLEIEEYRLLNGWSENRKKGSARMDRIPVRILKEYIIGCQDDYKMFIPEELPESFTSALLAKKVHITRRCAQLTLNILMEMKVIQRVGKDGRSFQYQRW